MIEAGDVQGVQELLTELATGLADQIIEETLEAGLAAAREEYTRQLSEAAAAHQRELSQVEQRYQAAAIIDSSDLTEGSRRKLRERFYDVFVEARTEEDGTVVPSERVLADQVAEAITEKKAELTTFVEAKVQGVGDTTTPSAEGGGRSGRRGRRGSGSLDSQLDRELQIPPAPPAEPPKE